MTHFLALILISPSTEDINTKVTSILAPYYLEREVPPYRRYFTQETIQGWAEKYKTGSDLEALCDHVRHGPWGDTCVDETGLYYMTTWNPRGMWDYWYYSGGEYMLGEQAWKDCVAQHGKDLPHEKAFTCNSCLVATMHDADFCPSALITPDGMWHDLVDWGWKLIHADSEESKAALAQWQANARAILKSNQEYLAVGIHCHG